MTHHGTKRAMLGLNYAILAALLLFVFFPIYWMLVTSLKSESQLRDVRQSPFWPTPFVFDSYHVLLAEQPFGQWFWNSLVVSVVSTVLAILIGTLGAYALARMRFRGRALLASTILITYLVPPTILFIPLFQVMRGLGLSNTLTSLALSYPTFTVPFVTWSLIGFFESIPLDLEEAAMTDGATRMQALVQVILPLAAPGLVAAALFAFTLAWNEFLYALTFISTPERQTLQVGITGLITSDVFLWGQLMAAATMTTLPVILVYMYLQTHMVAGLTAGGVKG
jgi:multiple sugar transport system permease protein